jgi:subfamily B ATP-binding cassette protein MsbA
VLYVIFNLLSLIFSLISLTLLAPFLQLLIWERKAGKCRTSLTIFRFSYYRISQMGLSSIIQDHGYIYALAAICITVVITILFKNLFLYLAMRVLSPMRIIIMKRLRADLYSKILDLPIGYFTEQRKGDIISKMSNDVNELEWSVIGTMEGLIREPMSILIILISLVLLSPPVHRYTW